MVIQNNRIALIMLFGNKLMAVKGLFGLGMKAAKQSCAVLS